MNPQIEVSLEANPSSVEASRFLGFREAGVNRISIGVQSLNETALRALGRLHSVEEAKQAILVANRLFDRVSFDLIYARSSQSVADWKGELNEALKLSAGHLSLYQLTIEPGTRFADLYNVGKLKMPSNQLAAEHYEATQDLCYAANLPAYEISNHAMEGQECAHNLVYWKYGAYAGIGPGAHGRIKINQELCAVSCEKNPERWSALVQQNECGFVIREVLNREEQALEMLLMGLRITSGFSINEMKGKTGYDIDASQLDILIDENLIRYDSVHRKIYVLDKGKLVLSYIISKISDFLIKPV